MIGYGNSMFIGSTLLSGGGGGGLDPDAQAFITAATITDPTQQAAINTLVVDLKGYNVWTKMQALYPMVGGTASTHKFNLKNPLDTNAAFRLSFIGGWTHSSTGATPNGTNGYADTFYNPNTNLSDINSSHLSYYSRTNAQGGHEMGASQGSTPVFNAALNFTGLSGTNVFNMNAVITHYQTDSRYFMINTRTASNSYKVLKNGSTSLGTSTTAPGTKANANVHLGNLNGYALWSTKQCASASIGSGLTDTEAANFYTAVQNFNTALARQV
jgi:hypothetical protein